MANFEMFPAHGAGAGAELARPVELVCFALVVAHGVYLAASYLEGTWPDGGGVPSDFVNIWAAGRMALAGHAAAAYDWPTHKLVEESAVGHPFEGILSWPYPPTFLFAAAALALLPYASAYVFWVFGTFLAYVVAIRAIIGDRVGYFLAAAFPAVLANFMVGQNGFLSAGLIGGTLTLIERRPICAGVLLGLLTYKPHLGLLFPIALMTSGHWRVFVTAGIVAALMAAASWAAFGSESWQAFFPVIGYASQALLSDGLADWGKLQTAFGLTRVLGGSEALAWTVQIVVALIAAGAIIVLWRSRAAYEIKAAALGTGALLATPYLFTYDLAVLAVPLAFLFCLGRARGFLPHEVAGIGLACLLILIFPFVKAPVGFAAVLVVAAMIVRRALAPRSVAI
jgi:arabinofuranan 3-O-arabinosyltransferase